MARPLFGRRLIDPLGGSKDLVKGVVRMVSERNLWEDPLRVLRCCRFAAQHGFGIEGKTTLALRKLAPLLACPAPERVTEELRYILASPHSRRVLERMRADGVLKAVLPGARKRGIRAVKGLEGIFIRFPHHRRFGPCVDIFSLKLAMLLKGAGERGFRRLVLSNREKELIERIHLSEKILRRLSTGNPERRILIRLLREAGDEVYTHLLAAYSAISASDNERPGKFLDFAKGLLGLYLKEVKPRMRTRLLTGDDLIAMGLKPGPEFKKILDEVELLWLEGRIRTREEALEAAAAKFS
jgi:tRNA nucleotidyltransferase/poly(A) polymerase